MPLLRVTGHAKANRLRSKAIAVLSVALSLVGLRAENRETEAKIELIGARFLCKSCDSPIVMNFQRLVFVFMGMGSPPTNYMLCLGWALSSAR
jgi:hypothetical protein